MKEQVKELRVKIDGLYQLTKGLKPKQTIENPNYMGFGQEQGDPKYITVIKNSQEIENAAKYLIYAKAWLGKVLGELGAENPYKSGYKTKDDIEPTADKAVNLFEVSNNLEHWGKDFNILNHIEKVDWLRTEIEKLISEIKQIGNAPNPPMLNREISIARTNAYNYLCEARFALGFELEKIKEENK